jgi:Mg2+ and Co2+ transporter CorA
MSNFTSIRELVSRLDRLVEMLASTEKMTIYSGFRGGKPMPLEQAAEKLEVISDEIPKIEANLKNMSHEESGSEILSLVQTCTMYLNRLRQNTETMKDIVGKFKTSQEGGKGYGFFKIRKDAKEWYRDTKKLLNVRSNVELFLRNAPR